MLELLCDFNTFVPSVKLLIHSHSLFNCIVLNQNGLSLVELLIQHSELDLNTEVINSLSCNQFIKLAEVVSSRHITESSVAPLSHI